MSLYGTGRAEGIGTAALIVTITTLVHCLGALQAHGLGGFDAANALGSAAVPALGGVLCYRFLRAQGRSRFASFLAAAAYALSPWTCAVAAAPREQLAAALAPFALEAMARCGRPDQRGRWLPWTGLAIAAPFAAGPAVVPLLSTGLAFGLSVQAVQQCDLGDRRRAGRGLAGAAVLAAVAAWSLLAIDPLGPVLGPAVSPRPATVLTAHRELGTGIDLAALLRLAGPVLLMFATLGVLRHQRHAGILRWGSVVVLGGAPTLLAAALGAPANGLPALAATAGWWWSLLGITVLGAAGLDDFLDLPLRRRTALPWLLSFAVAGAPLLPLGAVAPAREWPLTATVLLLALLLPTWRRVGILRFKNVLATATLLALAVPALQVLPAAPPVPPPAAPAGETAAPPDCLEALAARPLWHYSGLGVVLLVSAAAAWSAFRRSTRARPTPAAAKAAIRKKAKPPQRS